jgi:hypothetical protein
MILYGYVNFEELQGKTLVSVVNENDDKIIFTVNDGSVYEMYHSQNCCEDVYIESIVGELNDLVGSPILRAEVSTNDDADEECAMWTFYKIATFNGYVDIRWYGSSNGYYSVGVDFIKTK